MNWTLKATGIIALLGLVAGTVSSLLGIGAGVIIVPALSLWWDKIIDSPQKVAQGTALALMVPMALSGALRYHFGADPENWRMAVPIALYSIIGGSIIVAIPLLASNMLGVTEVLGHVNWHAVAYMMLGAVIGSVWLGAPLANSLPKDTLRALFGILLIFVGIRMVGLHTIIYNFFLNR
ncbi:MAG: TSUP family transporter [Armatimonadota bacterium]